MDEIEMVRILISAPISTIIKPIVQPKLPAVYCMLDGIGEQVMKGWHPKTCYLTRRMLCFVPLRLMSRCISMSEGTRFIIIIVLKLAVLSGMSHAWSITERHYIVSSIRYPNGHWHGRIISFKTKVLSMSTWLVGIQNMSSINTANTIACWP